MVDTSIHSCNELWSWSLKALFNIESTLSTAADDGCTTSIFLAAVAHCGKVDSEFFQNFKQSTSEESSLLIQVATILPR